MADLLLVEDDARLAELLASFLIQKEKMQVSIRYNLRQAKKALHEERFDLMILDLMLPDGDGIDFCKQLRKENIYIPILILTAKGEVSNKITGLEAGADDYLTKPFDNKELAARIHAVLRRQKVAKSVTEINEIIELGEFFIDVKNREARIHGKVINLTPKEFDLLYFLAKRPGKKFTREQLLNEVWGEEFKGYEHTVNSHINRLRVKIEKDPSKPKYVLTAWGVGYRFSDML